MAALVYVGDAMEENARRSVPSPANSALLGVKAFMFHEGRDPVAGRRFREIARLTGGAYAAFDARRRGGSPRCCGGGGLCGGRARRPRKQARRGGARLLLAQMR